MSLAIASRYARAMVDAVTAPGTGIDPKETIRQLQAVVELVKSSPELSNVLASPAVPGSRKRAVVSRLAPELGLSKLVSNFLFVVIDHRRTGLLKSILEAFEQQLDERLGIVRAEITTAAELNGSEHEALQSELSRITGKRVRMEVSVDRNLLAGLIARIGSTIYDGSLSGQMKALRRQLVSE